MEEKQMGKAAKLNNEMLEVTVPKISKSKCQCVKIG